MSFLAVILTKMAQHTHLIAHHVFDGHEWSDLAIENASPEGIRDGESLFFD